MEISVHFTDAGVHVYQADDQLAEKTIAAINPVHLYNQGPIEIAGSQSAILLNPVFIEYIEFKTQVRPAGLPGIPLNTPQLTEQLSRRFEPMKLISIGEYELARQTLSQELPPTEQPSNQGRNLNAVARMCFKSGTSLHLHLKGWLGPGEARRFVAWNIFAAPVLGAVRDEAGFVLINTKNLQTFTITPGPPEASKNAWLAEPVTPGARA